MSTMHCSIFSPFQFASFAIGVFARTPLRKTTSPHHFFPVFCPSVVIRGGFVGGATLDVLKTGSFSILIVCILTISPLVLAKFLALLAEFATHPPPTILAKYEQTQDHYYRPSTPTIFRVNTNVRRLLHVRAWAFGHLRRRRAHHITPQTRRQRREAAHGTFHSRAHKKPQTRRQRREAAHKTFHIKP